LYVGLLVALYLVSSFRANNILHCNTISAITNGLKNLACFHRIVRAMAKQMYHTGGSRKCKRLKLNVLANEMLSFTTRHPSQYQNPYHKERNTLNRKKNNSIFSFKWR